MPGTNVPRMTALDLVANMMLGSEPPQALPPSPREADSRHAVAEAIVPALMTGKCLVPFSGGRDSSAALALATAVARRRGLPDPIPVTADYSRATTPDEAEAQEAVIGHLKLREWERLEVDDEFQIVGPVARRSLRAHGVLFPASAYTMLPMLELAAGGAFLLAQGVNDFFYYWRFGEVADVLVGERRPTRRDLATLALGVMPAKARAALLRSRLPVELPWLRPAAATYVRDEVAARVASAPARIDVAVRRASLQRCALGAARSLAAMAQDAGAQLCLPFTDPAVVSASVAFASRHRLSNRTWWFKHYAGDLLPLEMLTRRRGTHLATVFFGEHTRGFAGDWSGGGLDDSLVDCDILREMWLGAPEDQDWRSAALMQLAWLHDQRDAVHGRGLRAVPALSTQ